MTVKKQDYILEALGQIDDKYIEEAVTYKKPKLSFLHRKEWSVLAACFVVVVLAGFAYRYMPIRSIDEVENVEGAVVECAEGDEVATTENIEGYLTQEYTYSYGVVFVPVMEEGAVEELTEDKQQDVLATNDLCGYPTVESLQEQEKAGAKEQASVNYSITSAKSRAEIINEATDAFRGTVTTKEVYLTEGAIETVFTILTVEVDEVIKGNAVQGKTYKIYIPVGEADGLATDDSLSGNLLKIEVGTKGTFIPEKTTAQTGFGTTGTAEAWLSYADVADYYILNGVQHFILEAE